MKVKFNEIFVDCTRDGIKIPKESYLKVGKHIIIDQGQNEVAGFTNQEEGLYINVPAIIFGDHTRTIKYVDVPFFLGADGVKLLKSSIKDVNYKYLYYALSSLKLQDLGYNRHFKLLKESKIEICDIKTQNNIVIILDRINSIIQKQKIIINYFNTLIKARFVEMFGDSPNDKFNSIKLGEVSTSRGEYGANSASIEYSNNRARYIRITDINDDGTLNNDMVASYNTTDDDKYKLEYGDIIFARTGATVGKSYYYNTKEKQIFAGYLIRFKIDIKKMIPIFVFYNTKMKYYNEWIKYSQGGVAQPNINEKKYSNLDLINAPINLQESFATFVQHIDKLKFE